MRNSQYTYWLVREKKHSSCINAIISVYSSHIFESFSCAKHQAHKKAVYMWVCSSRDRLKWQSNWDEAQFRLQTPLTNTSARLPCLSGISASSKTLFNPFHNPLSFILWFFLFMSENRKAFTVWVTSSLNDGAKIQIQVSLIPKLDCFPARAVGFLLDPWWSRHLKTMGITGRC